MAQQPEVLALLQLPPACTTEEPPTTAGQV